MITEPVFEKIEQTTYSDHSRYECRAVLIKEDDGYSVYASRLPGVHSQGGSRKEAIANISEAFVAAIESYTSMSRDIPWRDADVDASGEEVWILVDV